MFVKSVNRRIVYEKEEEGGGVKGQPNIQTLRAEQQSGRNT